jgi:NADH:ubiquinone oxidoreductase subunit F (NADH-binding)/NADH:ubiquinone oxidoreductase subunit E
MKLLRRLHELQESRGYLSEESLRELARQENVPLYRLQGLVSFYPHFRTKPPPRVELAVCRDASCWLAGGVEQCRRLRAKADGVADVEVREVSCLGRCDAAPAGDVNGTAVSLSDPARIEEWLLHPERATPVTRPQGRAWRCDPYDKREARFSLLRELLSAGAASAAERVIAAIKQIGLRGMGGAGYPAGRKWEVVRAEQRTPKYVICNADESEPGTFKDRVILAELPHLVIEGMILAGLVTGAEHGILFIRHEYAPERQAFAEELDHLRGLGLVNRSDFRFDIEIFTSPGGYILGEETALLEALEDKRGEPRNKPPYPGTHGLHGQPTLINNVETLAMVPAIVARGPQWWKGQGRPGFSGLKFVSVSGHVERSGVFEIPVGTTVRELIEMAGGMRDGKPLKAFAPGGASSNFLPAELVDTPFDFEALSKAGSMLGSGALIVVAEGTDMLALATNLVRFFRNESCGKCVPCRLGSQEAVQILERIQTNRSETEQLNLLPPLGETMAVTSICGLGQVALNPILSVMRHWPEEVGKQPAETP